MFDQSVFDFQSWQGNLDLIEAAKKGDMASVSRLLVMPDVNKNSKDEVLDFQRLYAGMYTVCLFVACDGDGSYHYKLL